MRPMIRSRHAVFVMLLYAVLSGCSQAERPPILAGSATLSITPDPATHNIPLGGYGAREGRPATGVRDPVMTRTLYLQQGETKIALVACDLVFIPGSLAEAVRYRLQAGRMDDVRLFLAATHSHAAPEAMAMHPGNKFKIPSLGVFDPWLLNWTADVVALCIAQAIESAQPARIALGTRETQGLVRNRRGDPLTDPRMTLLGIGAGPDRPIAMLTHFAAHPTVLDSDMMEISAGWPGVLCRTLERQVNAGVKTLYLNGAQGDVSPVADGSGTNVERMILYGRRIAEEALACLDGAREIDSPVLSATTAVVHLPPRTVSPQFAAIAGEEYGLDETAAKIIVSSLFPEQADVLAVRIGPLILVGVPGELTASLGLRIREAIESAGGVTAVVVGLVGDYIGYVLPPEEYDQGGYEPTVSFYGRTLGPAVVEAAVQAGKALMKEVE